MKAVKKYESFIKSLSGITKDSKYEQFKSEIDKKEKFNLIPEDEKRMKFYDYVLRISDIVNKSSRSESEESGAIEKPKKEKKKSHKKHRHSEDDHDKKKHSKKSKKSEERGHKSKHKSHHKEKEGHHKHKEREPAEEKSQELKPGTAATQPKPVEKTELMTDVTPGQVKKVEEGKVASALAEKMEPSTKVAGTDKP